MIVSEITLDVVKDWIGVSDGDEINLAACLAAAKSHACSYTGLTIAQLDQYEELAIAVLGLCNDFYTNNRPSAAEISVNKMSASLLAMHSKNLL